MSTLFFILLSGWGQSLFAAAHGSAHLVQVIKAEKTDIELSYSMPCTLFSQRKARIYTQEQGQIIKLPFYPGDRVEQGQQVAQLSSKILSGQLRKAKANRQQAEVDLERQRKLKKRNAGSEDEYARAQTSVNVARAEESLLATRIAFTRISAPFTGIVTERLQEPGDVVSGNTQLLTIEDPDSMRVRCLLSGTRLAALHKGQPVTIQVNAIVGQTFQGQVSRIHPNLDPATRLGVTEITFDSIPEQARSGQYAQVDYQLNWKDLLIIPASAIQYDHSGRYVYVVNQQQQVARKNIISGVRDSRRVVINQGLQEGDRVITRGFFGLKTGSLVTIVKPER
ncbi:MAG: efflux RND transporter periplasmic adaptor subunit [gamma proteobacterium symbiont of Bathyaustriella thionipta]|nr:efflux RND transporter periplasmic adaptor subunit [gamma proteobacterium symbiont of Bathyaustriella thionipta]